MQARPDSCMGAGWLEDIGACLGHSFLCPRQRNVLPDCGGVDGWRLWFRVRAWILAYWGLGGSGALVFGHCFFSWWEGVEVCIGLLPVASAGEGDRIAVIRWPWVLVPAL